MAVVIVIGYVIALAAVLVWTTAAGSGAASMSTPAARTAAPEKVKPRCPSAKRAVAFYSGRVRYWLDRMGAGSPRDAGPKRSSASSCPRYLATVLQRKASALREAHGRWVAYHWHWWKWMPSKWQRIGACETGYGKRPGNFDHDSGTYVSFAGIIRSGYDSFARRLGLPTWAGNPTPHQQLLVAQSLQAAYGYGAWGCGGA